METPQLNIDTEPSTTPTPTTTMNEQYKEITINRPTPFTGDRSRIRGFLQQCQGYLQLNRRVYTTNEAKIAFILSFLTDGEALKWRETYLSGLVQDDGSFKYPEYHIFLDLFTNYFKPINQTQTANNQLANLKQGKRTVEDYVAEFRLLITMAGMTSDTPSDNIHLINYFRRGLNPAIARKIALSDRVPTTISDWADRAIQYDTNYRLTMAMFGRSSGGRANYEQGRAHTSIKDPYAMDIDAMMTDERRATLMRQGLCFKCEGKGHLAKECKTKKNPSTQKRSVKDIHALLAELTKEEKEELVTLQKEDF